MQLIPAAAAAAAAEMNAFSKIDTHLAWTTGMAFEFDWS